MTPKERMLMAIAHEEPDRVPVSEWQFGREIFAPVIGREPIAFTGLGRAKAMWAGRRDDVTNEWKHGLVELVRRFEWDAVLVHVVIGKDTEIPVPEPLPDGTWRDPRGYILTYSESTDRLFITKKEEQAAAPAADPAPADLTPTDSELEVVRHVVGELGKTHFVFAAPLRGHPTLNFSDASVSGLEAWVKLYEDPDRYAEQALAGMTSEHTRLGIETAKREGLDGVAMGCDYGCNTGPFMSPDLFRRCIQPSLAAFCDLVHSYGLTMLLHACGNNQVLMDMIVEAGVDVYQSIQTEMDIIKIKQRYGKHITLWGGVPAGDLVTGTPEQVRGEAIRYLEACKPGGGYVFATTHSVMPGATLENYEAMLQAHREFGGYAKEPA